MKSAGPLRITHLVENLERGGLERMVVDLSAEQAAQGHAVEVLCLFEEGLLAPELRIKGVPVTALHKRPGLHPAVVLGIARHLRARRTDVLHTHNAVAHYHGVAASMLAGPVGIVNTRHGMGNAPFQRRREMLYRLALQRTAAAAMVCESARRNFVTHRIVPEQKSRGVPNGIDVDTFRPASAELRADTRRALGVPQSAFVIGTVGRLNPVKDHAMLLRAMARVCGASPAAHLVVVGGGALLHELGALAGELRIAHRVTFGGDRGDVQALLPAFDVFALSSISEGYSISLLEACACGLPIVATDVGGNREIVRPGGNGVLVPARDDEAMAAALLALEAQPQQRARLGEAARAWVAAHGTVRVMAQRYLELYRDARP